MQTPRSQPNKIPFPVLFIYHVDRVTWSILREKDPTAPEEFDFSPTLYLRCELHAEDSSVLIQALQAYPDQSEARLNPSKNTALRATLQYNLDSNIVFQPLPDVDKQNVRNCLNRATLHIEHDTVFIKFDLSLFEDPIRALETLRTFLPSLFLKFELHCALFGIATEDRSALSLQRARKIREAATMYDFPAGRIPDYTPPENPAEQLHLAVTEQLAVWEMEDDYSRAQIHAAIKKLGNNAKLGDVISYLLQQPEEGFDTGTAPRVNEANPEPAPFQRMLPATDQEAKFVNITGDITGTHTNVRVNRRFHSGGPRSSNDDNSNILSNMLNRITRTSGRYNSGSNANQASNGDTAEAQQQGPAGPKMSRKSGRNSV